MNGNDSSTNSCNGTTVAAGQVEDHGNGCNAPKTNGYHHHNQNGTTTNGISLLSSTVSNTPDDRKRLVESGATSLSAASSTKPTTPFTIASDQVRYTDDTIISHYTYQSTVIDTEQNIIQPIQQQMIFRTKRHVPKLGVMLVGLGGNNGSTCVAGTIANRLGLRWETKDGIHTSNYLGSVVLSSTTNMGYDSTTGQPIYMPLHSLLPMTHPNDIVWSGWDINDMNLGDAMKRAKVLDYHLQQQLYPHMKEIVPLPSIYFPDYIAANQCHRANNILSGSKEKQMTTIRQNIQDFRKEHSLEKVIVVWTANTERYTDVQAGIHDTSENLMRSIQQDHTEISPSTIFAMASILEGCTFINGSPQNTFVPGVVELALERNVFIAGDDFKSGQTKIKSVLVDFLVSAGIKPLSIVSYNHLGNNDGKNLSEESQFRSKEISKSNVVDDMVASNKILYPSENDHPDHVVVIKYVPAVSDSKRAMDEYTSEIFMGGKNTIVIHNTCEDSLLATPLIYDLVILAELCERIAVKRLDCTSSITNNRRNGLHIEDHGDVSDESGYETFHPVLSLLSYMLKAPLVPENTPVINALFPQREAITNIIRACIGLSPNHHMALEHRFRSSDETLHDNEIHHKKY